MNKIFTIVIVLLIASSNAFVNGMKRSEPDSDISTKKTIKLLPLGQELALNIPLTRALTPELIQMVVAFLPDVASFCNLISVCKKISSVCFNTPAKYFVYINLSQAILKQNFYFENFFQQAIRTAITNGNTEELQLLLSTLSQETLQCFARQWFEVALSCPSNGGVQVLTQNSVILEDVNDKDYIIDLFNKGIDTGAVRRIRHLLNQKNKIADHMTFDEIDRGLLESSESGNVALVKLFLDNEANTDFIDAAGQTPLFLASDNGHANVVKVLIEIGADKEIARDGVTPLFIASENGHVEVVEVLVKNGANKETAKDGATPLFQASQHGRTEVVKVLVENGANVNAIFITDEESHTVHPSLTAGIRLTPFDIAQLMRRADIAQLLFEHGGLPATAIPQ